MEGINEEEIQSLIEYFAKTMYRTKYEDDVAKSIMNKCVELAKLDYNITVLDNTGGHLCAHYPSQIIIMESDMNTSGKLIEDTIYESVEQHPLNDLVVKARSARCRTRFPVPVIFYQGKYICRSATLSGGPEIYGRSGLGVFFNNDSTNGDQQDQKPDNKKEEDPENEETGDDKNNDEPDNMQVDNEQNDKSDNKIDNKQADQSNYNWVLCDTVRKGDITLLKALNVGIIVDLMVEKKKVKFGLNVTSSEKVDKINRYSEFAILSLPYPGCEFFREFRDQNYSAENLFYNWSQSHVDAEIIVPQDNVTEKLSVKWKDYKKWNLPTLTENYLQLLLRYTFDSSSGLLVHCISGWDRTPLFVSLLRICLWADGSIHKSLTPMQMLYFTIAYDWLLFGHDLQDRKNKGEDIFYYCFYFLKFVLGDEYSSQRCRVKVPQANNPVPVEYMQCDTGDLEASDLTQMQESYHSLNSSWSSISSRSQEIIPAYQSDDLNNIPAGGLWLGDQAKCSEGSHSTQSSSSSASFSSTLIDNSADQRGLMTPSPAQAPATPPSASQSLKMSQATSTSPVAVPLRASMRQRNESSSSLSVGSWQYVTSTGSLRSTTSASSTQSSSNSRSGTDPTQNEPANPDASEGCFIKRKHSTDHAQCGSSCAVRRERLEQIRKLFYNCYCQSIGHNLKDGSENSAITNIIGNIAGKIYSNPKI